MLGTDCSIQTTNTSWRLYEMQHGSFMYSRNTQSRVNYGKNFFLYYSGHQPKLINGIGILIQENWQVNFVLISDRIWKITIKLTNSGNKFIIMNLYATTLECNDPDQILPMFFIKIRNCDKEGQIQRQSCSRRRFEYTRMKRM